LLADLAARARAARLARPPARIRAERFGAVAQLGWPRALAFVDRAMARRLGIADHARWRAAPDGDGVVGAAPLAAPLEAHLQLTNRCDVGCQGCYTGATPQGGAREWGEVEWRRAIDHLADRGVFHLALGGGESATLPWLGAIADHARARGLVPNLTTSGLAGLDRLVPIAAKFGQINVSLDGLGATYRDVRGVDGFAAADAALVALRRVKREIGINVVVTRANFAQLDAIFAHAGRRRLNEVELLRFKPSGRGAAAYPALRCTDAQHRALLPDVLRAVRRHRVRVRVDCSYTPMIAHHAPGPDLLAGLAVYGCVGGDFLIGARATGVALACSFATPPASRPPVDELAAYWERPDAFPEFRGWRDAAEPCRSCAYHHLCRGGCRVVAAHAGAANAPDPECPRVVDHAAAHPARAKLRVIA
jgi:radical SAM protein with 4Fe4S-binding SPASM domain